MSSIANSAMPFNNSASDGLTITGVIWNQAMQTIVTSVNDNATQINNIRNAQTTILVGTGSVYPTSPIPSNGQLFYRTDLQALKMFNGTSWIDPVQEPTSYVDLTTGQTIGGSKTFTNPLTIKTDTSGALTIERASNTNQQILIDYDNANNRGRIQTVEQGVSYRDLILNASGGQVLTQHNTLDDGSSNIIITGSSTFKAQMGLVPAGTGNQWSPQIKLTGQNASNVQISSYLFADTVGSFLVQNGSGVTGLSVTQGGVVATKNNTVDDGSGGMTLAGLLKMHGASGQHSAHVYDDGTHISGFGTDMSGTGRELTIFHTSSTHSDGRISFGHRYETDGSYTERVSIDGSGNTTIAGALTVNGSGGSFANSKATNGYQKLAGGLIIQWGSGTSSSGSGTEVVVTLPTTFPNAFLAGGVSNANGGSTSFLYIMLIACTTSQIAIFNNGSNNATYCYWAIGY